MKKLLIFIITLVIILSSITILPKNFYVQASGGGQTLFVGGTGGGNYTKIQDAIENASTGDTVFVYENTYYENIIINVSINLTGENKDTTIIDGVQNGNTITITADYINLSGFTIQNGGTNENDAGLKIYSNDTNISNSIIKNCSAFGLILENGNNNTIYSNTFTNITNISSIHLWNTSAYNTISNNNITNSCCAIDIGNGSHHNNITNNNIDNNIIGIHLWINTTNNNSIFRNSILNSTHNGLLIDEATSNKIFENQFEKNGLGVKILGQIPSNKNMIYHNNFINNTRHIYDESNQTWDNNYPSGGNFWDIHTNEDLLSGSTQNDSGSDGIGDLPYEIVYNVTQDKYPLINPWGEYSPVAKYDSSVENKTAYFNASDSYDRDNTIVSYEWAFGDLNNSTGKITNHTYSIDGGYNITLTIVNNDGTNDTITKYIYIGNDTTPPEITNVSSDPTCVGFGFNVTINVTVIDNVSRVMTVTVNITFPDNTSNNFTMDKITNNNYSYTFSDTWAKGQYNYSIWTRDYKGNNNSSTNHSFNVSAQAIITIATLKDSYGDNESINITDPPIPPSDYYLVGRGPTWNEYYNATSGKNIREIYTSSVNYQGEDGSWTPIECDISLLDSSHPAYSYGYRIGNEHGLYNVYLKPDAQSSWPVAFAYNKSTSPDSHAIRSKLVGVGYLDPSQNWAYEYLQSVKSSQGQITNNSITYENIFTGVDVVFTYGNIGLKEEIIMSNSTKTLLQDNPPSDYDLSNQDSYLVFITKLDYNNLDLYNTSGILTGNFTTIDDQIDFKDALGHIKCALPVGEAYELNNKSVRYGLTYRILQYKGNYYLLSGMKVIDLNSMMFPVVIDPTLTLNSSTGDGHAMKEGSSYSTIQGASEGNPRTLETTFSIGQRYDSFAPPWLSYTIWRGFVYFDTMYIPSNSVIDSAVLSLYKDSDSSTTDFDIVIQNGQPTYPDDPLDPFDYNKSYYSGNGGSINTTNFSSGYNNITLTNHSWINLSGRTKLCLRSSRDIDSVTPTGNEYVTIRSSDYPLAGSSPKLVVEYRNQSKIKNTGSTDISGYLLMQIHYYNSSQQNWSIDCTVINETTPRIINSSEQIALDLIFNDLVNTWNLSNRNGTYRVYAAFRDSSGYVLKCDDDSYMETSYDFQVNFVSDSDSDGIADYLEKTCFGTDLNRADTDLDTYSELVDIDPLVNLEVTLTIKRIYASEYTYTWREGENWDTSETNCTGANDGTEWVKISDSKASGGYYTRQNDDRDALDDFAEWDLTVNDPGIYHIWMRSHRYEYGCSNATLWWINSANVATRIYSRSSDYSKLGTEPMWYQDTTDEWKWSWYGVVDVEETGDYTLKINNTEVYEDKNEVSGKRDDLGWSHGDPEYWMEVDNILITDDPNCIPHGKGIEDKNDNTIGYSSVSSWDPPGSGDSAPDFYVKATIAGTTQTSDIFENDFNVLDDYVFDPVDVPDNVEEVPITIELWEDDGASDTLCDINGSSDETKLLNITYNLRNGTWWGDDYINDTDLFGRTAGEADGSWQNDANLIFNVTQNDYDNDGITWWRETNVFKAGTSSNELFDPKVKNDRYAVIIGGGTSCKVIQSSSKGSDEDPCDGPYLLYDGGSSWTDYTFEVDLMTNEKLDDDKETIGVMFRYQDSQNYYILRWEKNGPSCYFYLDEVVNGDRSNLGKVYNYLEKFNWYTIKVELSGNDIYIIRTDNSDGTWCELFDISDNSHSSGSIALFCWKNVNALFDDVRVVDSDGDVLLVEGFDYSIIPSSDWTDYGDGTWEATMWKTDQEEMYKELDFLYRELINTFHYDEDDIYYLSAHKWRDADCDNNFDVDCFSTESNIKSALNTWLKESSDSNDMNFVYVITHGYYTPVKFSGLPGYSQMAFDSDRDGKAEYGLTSIEINECLEEHNYGSDIGRLVFIFDTCMSGQYIDALGKSDEDRIIMVSSSIYEVAELETGQDWGAFSYKFFCEMADGETDVAEAFNKADKHVTTKNFMSIDIIKEWGFAFWPQDSRLEDNGNAIGSNYNLPSEGDWFNVYEGDTLGWKIKSTPNIGPNYKITKARIRLNTRIGFSNSVSGNFYEFSFHNKDTNKWVKPDGHYDRLGLWANEGNAYDGNVFTKASCTKTPENRYPYGDHEGPDGDFWKKLQSTSRDWFWTPYLVFTLDDPITCDKIKFKAWYSYLHSNIIDVDVYYSGYQEGNLAGKTGL